MINAGAVNHPFHPHGNHTRQIAQDGRLRRRRPTEHFGETIGSGQTEDFLLRWDDAGRLESRPRTRCRWRSRTTAT